MWIRVIKCSRSDTERIRARPATNGFWYIAPRRGRRENGTGSSFIRLNNYCVRCIGQRGAFLSRLQRHTFAPNPKLSPLLVVFGRRSKASFNDIPQCANAPRNRPCVWHLQNLQNDNRQLSLTLYTLSPANGLNSRSNIT